VDGIRLDCGKMEDELTELDYQNPIQGPVPKDPKKLDIEEVVELTDERATGSTMIRTRGAALKERVSWISM
jgi:hypothetical protein